MCIGWINCKDSLPDINDDIKKSEYCLVWDGDEVQKAALQQYPDKTKIWEIYHPVSSAADEPIENVTHWMILPSPPLVQSKPKGDLPKTKRKSLIINNQTNDCYAECFYLLSKFMFDDLEKNNENLEFFNVRLKDSEKAVNAKEMVFEWAFTKTK